MKKLFLLCLLLARAEVWGSDKLAELTYGKIWSKDDQFFEAGFDLEYFLPGFHHRVSVGLASEIEFEDENEFYAGPLVSFYFHEFKAYLTSGLQGHDSYWRVKSRLGAGYEIRLSNDYLLIPNATFDFIDQEIHPGVSLGVARFF
jgi:hypothetical protein